MPYGSSTLLIAFAMTRSTLTLLLLAFISAAASAQARLDFAPTWVRSTAGRDAGMQGFAVLDLGTRQEIACTARSLPQVLPDYWFVLRHDPVTRNYVQIFASTLYPAAIRDIAAGDVDGDGRPELLILLVDGRTYVYDASDYSLRFEFSVAQSTPKAMRVVDVDRDGVPEIVSCGDDLLAVHNGLGQRLWSRTRLSGDDFVLGQLDRDPSLELVGGDGEVFDVDSQTFQCTLGFSASDLELGDADGDGIDEIVVFAPSMIDRLSIWDVETCSQIYGEFISELRSIAVRDLNDDGHDELLLGSGDTYLLVRDLRTMEFRLRFFTQHRNVTHIEFGDVDRDGITEILWASGNSGMRISVADPLSMLVDWISTACEGPFRGPLRGDVDGDGVEELVVCSEGSETDSFPRLGGRILLLDPETGQPRAVSPSVGDQVGSMRILSEPALADIDGDGDVEIAVGGRDGYPTVEIWDYHPLGGWAKLTRIPYPGVPGDEVKSLAFAQVSGDSREELLVGPSAVGNDEVRVHGYDPLSMQVVWTSPVVGSRTEISMLRASNLDSDSSIEVVAMCFRDDVAVIDADSGTIQARLSGRHESFDLFEPGSGIPALLVVGGQNGLVVAHSLGRSGVLWSGVLPLGLGPIEGLNVLPNFWLFVQSGDTLALVDPLRSAIPVWSTEELGPDRFDRILFDFTRAAFFRAGPHAVVRLELR